jgi:hypothetical protein
MSNKGPKDESKSVLQFRDVLSDPARSIYLGSYLGDDGIEDHGVLEQVLTITLV